MISKNVPRENNKILTMLDFSDYDVLKKHALEMTEKMSNVKNDDKILWNDKIDVLINYFNKIFPNFLDVFIRQTNNCFIEKLEDNNNEKMLPALKESEFYTHILDNDFVVFLNTFETKSPLKWVLKYPDFRPIQVLSFEYFDLLQLYLFKVANSKDYKDLIRMLDDDFIFNLGIFTCSY